MVGKNLLLATVTALTLSAAQVGQAFDLVSKKGVSASVVLGPNATKVESHAAEELGSYVRRLTGVSLTVQRQLGKSGGSIVLIGRTETNPVIAELVRRGKLELSTDKPGLDGFIVKTVEDAGRTYLVLGGSTDRSSIYAVYDFLERFCHVGFFWDVERVPRAKSLVFERIDFTSRPYFENRQNMQGCAWGYSAAYWGWKDWKREIDWTAKKKFNILFVYNGREQANYEVLKSLGVSAPELSARDKGHAALARKITSYAHSLGIRTVTMGSIGEVPPAFKELYPDAKYIEAQWLDYPTRLYLHPADPMFVRLIALQLRQHGSDYGTSNIYNFDPYPETAPGSSPEEKLKLSVSFAKSVTEAIESVSPDGLWIMSGWAFLDRKYWTDEQVQAFLGAIPTEMLIVNDIWAEHKPVYKSLDYLYGKNWGFGVLHAFGGNTHMHGDVAGLIKSVQEIAADPKAQRCRSFYVNPEIVRHNPFYFDLAAQMSWDPRGVTPDDYIRDYALRRYGAASASRMTDCLTELSTSVYSRYDHSGPVYQFSPTTRDTRRFDRRVKWIPSLKKALDIALEESNRQVGNPCYQRDIIDLSKEYLGNVATEAYQNLLKAFEAKDKGAFEAAANRMRTVMDNIEQVVALCPDYYLAEEIGRATQSPYRLKPKDAAVDVRARYSVLMDFGHYDTLLDYARKDMFELVKYYYRPRMEILISHLDECLKTDKSASDQEIHDRCKDICIKFVNDSPMAPLPNIQKEHVAEKVGETLANLGL